jgi:hypothetical protein
MSRIKWSICPVCEGEGSHSIKLGVINMEDWGHDELEDYFAGAYDSECECCAGAGKVTEEQTKAHYRQMEDQRIADKENGYFERSYC